MSKIYSKNPKTGPNYFTPHENWHKQLNWSSLVQFWGFIVMRCLIISSLSDTLWLFTASYTTFIAFPPLPNLLFLEQLPLPITTRAHTGIWIGGGFFFLTNDLTNNSASAKERGPHHFFLSPLMECVCLSVRPCCRLSHPSTILSLSSARGRDAVWSSIFSANLYLLTLHLWNLFPLDILLNYIKWLLC